MFGLLISNAYAQDAAQQGPSGFASFIPMIAIGFVIYFLMIRPQNKKMQQEREYISALQKGDEVYTKSGLIGKIHGLTDKIVTLELDGGTKVKMLRGTIAGPVSQLFEEKPEAKK
jgi:preprotein translocase subunit YajC